MTDKQLIDDILIGKQHHISDYLMDWLSTCTKFRTFLRAYSSKIRSKIRNAKSDEDLEDIIFELEVAYLFLLDNRFELEYEKYGNGKSRAPDFYAIYDKFIFFNVEARRIREPQLATRINTCFQEIEAEVRNFSSDICVQIRTKTMDADPNLVGRLESSKKIIKFIEKVIQIEKNKLAYDSTCEYPLDGFEDVFTLVLTRPSGKVDKIHTSYYSASVPIFYTQEEYRKFGDIVCEKLGQMRPNMINVLIVGSISSTHEREDLPRAIDSINDLLLKNDDNFFIRKGFKSAEDFIDQMKNLSAILFRSIWIDSSNQRNSLWINENANFELLEDIIKLLPGMDKPKVITKRV